MCGLCHVHATQETPPPPLPKQEPPPSCTRTAFLDPFLDPSWTHPAQEPPPPFLHRKPPS